MKPDVSHRLATRILCGLAVGVAAGVAARVIGQFHAGFLDGCQRVSTAVLDPFGQVFLRLLFFVVIPLVFSSLAMGVLQLGDLRKLGPLAMRTGALFLVNMAVGVALGLLMMNVLQPGHSIDAATRDTLMADYGAKAREAMTVQQGREGLSLRALVEMFMPRNLLGSVANFEILPLILFAILVGAAGTQLLNERHRAGLREFLTVISELMTRIVHYALLLAPYAVPAMIFSVIVKAGLGVIYALMVFVLACLGVMLLHLFGTMSVLLKLFSRRPPLVFFRDIRTVLITAFSTSSSNATLPASLQVSRDVLKISPSTAGFVLPLGATMNMSGTALYEGCVVLFIAQIFGIEIPLAAQATLLVLAVLSAVAVAGIPGGSLPLIAGLLATYGVPPEGLAIILGVDRVLDMARTVVNVAADLVTAAIVDSNAGGNAA